MMRNLGIVRNNDSIIRGLNDVLKIERESKGLSAKLNDMILVSKFIIIGAYLRRESRGCHLRSDYQDTDEDFIKHFDIKYSEIDGYIKTILDSNISEVDEKLVS
jgi:aspartate oxidase